MLITALLLSATVLGALGIGRCPDPDTQKDFDIEQYVGTWYEIESTEFVFGQGAKKCSQFVITADENQKGNGGMLHKHITHTFLGDKTWNTYYDLAARKKSEPAKFDVTPKKGTIARSGTLGILATDYKTYALSYTCSNLLFITLEEVYLLSRTKTMNETTKMELYDILKERNFSTEKLEPIDHKYEGCEKLDKE